MCPPAESMDLKDYREHAQLQKAQNVRGTVRTVARLESSTSEKGSAKAGRVLIF